MTSHHRGGLDATILRRSKELRKIPLKANFCDAFRPSPKVNHLAAIGRLDLPPVGDTMEGMTQFSHRLCRSSACLSVVLMLCALGAAPARAQIQRWVDDQGVVHFSNAGPQPSDQVASPVTELPLARQPSAADAAAAQQQLKKYQEQLAQKPTAPASAAPAAPAAKGPSPNDQSCAAQWARYNASYACMDPYRMSRGGIRPEAFEKCPQVAQPDCPAP